MSDLQAFRPKVFANHVIVGLSAPIMEDIIAHNEDTLYAPKRFSAEYVWAFNKRVENIHYVFEIEQPCSASFQMMAGPRLMKSDTVHMYRVMAVFKLLLPITLETLAEYGITVPVVNAAPRTLLESIDLEVRARIVWSVADEPIGSDEEAKRDKPTNVNQVAVQCVDGEPILPETEALKRGKSLRREAFVMMPRK